MNDYHEDFKHSSPLTSQVSALQEAMEDRKDEELLEMVSMDGLLVM